MINIVSTLAIIAILLLVGSDWLYVMPVVFSSNLLWWVLLTLILGALNHWYLIAAHPKKGYALREHDLHFCCGLFFYKHLCQPILRIQHVEIKRGLAERRLGLASLIVYSAGSTLDTFQIPGLELEQAVKMRGYILNHHDLILEEVNENGS
jgi:membrane protein YdbS with pleckstrin-like domain